jgi:GDP-L-fucose synthase
MQTILVTGGSGMVGKNFLTHSLSKKYKLVAPNRAQLDLSNKTEVAAFFKKVAPDLVIHCAGKVGGIKANMSAPVDFLVENLDLGRNVIMAAYQAGVKRLINLSSSCMYPRHAPNPLKEELVLTGELEPTNEGYALAKIVAMRLCHYIGQQNSQFLYKTVIPCNLYGRYDRFDQQASHMIPAAIMKVHHAIQNNMGDVEIWGDGEARREFMDASDLADFLYFAVENFEKLPALMNLGLGFDNSINEYYQAIAKVLGHRGKFVHDLTKPAGMKQKVVDISKQKVLGWSPKKSLEDGIKSTYDYYLNEVLK